MRVLVLAFGIFFISTGFVAGNNQLFNLPLQTNAPLRTNLPSPTSTTPPGVPYQTVIACQTTSDYTSCATHTSICPQDSTTFVQTWASEDCNNPNLSVQPRPPLLCWTPFSEEIGCEATGTSSSLPAASGRSVRMVANHVRATSTALGGRSQRLVAKVAHSKSTTGLGGRSQRWVAHAARSISTTFLHGRSQRSVGQATHPTHSSHLSGRSQHSVAHAIQTSTDLGGRSQRWVAQAAHVTPAVDQSGKQGGYVNHVTTLVTVAKADD